MLEEKWRGRVTEIFARLIFCMALWRQKRLNRKKEVSISVAGVFCVFLRKEKMMLIPK